MAKSRVVEKWFTKANSDLRFAKAALSLKENFYDQIVFHCQQSVEKSIKGLLAHHKRKFTKTHDIGELLIIVAQIDTELSELLSASRILTKYAVSLRYPEAGGDEEELSLEVVKRCLDLAQSVSVEIGARVR